MVVGEEGIGVGESLSLCDERWNVFLRRDVRESGVEGLRVRSSVDAVPPGPRAGLAGLAGGGAKSGIVGVWAEVGRRIGWGLGGVRGCECGGGGGGGGEGERAGTGFRVLEFVLRLPFPFPLPFASSSP